MWQKYYEILIICFLYVRHEQSWAKTSFTRTSHRRVVSLRPLRAKIVAWLVPWISAKGWTWESAMRCYAYGRTCNLCDWKILESYFGDCFTARINPLGGLEMFRTGASHTKVAHHTVSQLPTLWRLMQDKIHRLHFELAGEGDQHSSEPRFKNA